MIQYHTKGKGANFAKTWNEYKDGFGSLEQGFFWIDLENMHNLTKSGSYGLQVSITEGEGVVKTVEYDSFRVSDEADEYRLHLSGFKSKSWGISDRMNYHNNKPFTTTDRDNDHWRGTCAYQTGGGGWWYWNCYAANQNHPDGLTWKNDKNTSKIRSWRKCDT